MPVVWELNVPSILSILSSLFVMLVYGIRASDRSIRAENKADATAEGLAALRERVDNRISETDQRFIKLQTIFTEVEESRRCAERCKEQVALLNASFNAYQIMAMDRFIGKEEWAQAELRSERALETAVKRLEKSIDERGPVHVR